MSNEFVHFQQAVAKKFVEISKYPLFVTEAGHDRDAIFEKYLDSFPEGTNNIYREKREFDCNCCKSFIRQVGAVVAIDPQHGVHSIWDVETKFPHFNAVAKAMAKYVKSFQIVDAFLFAEKTCGTGQNYMDLDGTVKEWKHFFINIPEKNRVGNLVIGSKKSEFRAQHDVFKRGMEEVTLDALDTVIELITQNSLYKGDENLEPVKIYRGLKRDFLKLSDDKRDFFCWEKIFQVSPAISTMRNSLMGTLLVDLSEGVDLEVAVASFEKKAAPENYKRPTALVTKAMVEKAKATIEELGLTSALKRRHATIDDISVTNILFLDKSVSKVIEEDVFDGIASSTPKKLDKVEEIGVEQFLKKVLPNVQTLEVLFENQHVPNLVSLTVSEDPTAGLLFKWDNNFAWTYNGDVTDSIKERVKKAGGNVSGELCCRLSWFNYDDLDLHMKEPDFHIFYGQKGPSPNGGELDVDMNAGGGYVRDAVENIFYKSCKRMKDGVYKLEVNNYSKRETIDVGFDVEIDYLGDVCQFHYSEAVPHGRSITVAEIHVKNGAVVKIVDKIPSVRATREVWGINTNDFVKVQTLMRSPNYWGENKSGNCHYFFMLENCKNDLPARGFYNEFLKEELNKHRKVFEIVGSKIKVDEAQDQLSGLGFSTTIRKLVIVRVSGKITRLMKVMF